MFNVKDAPALENATLLKPSDEIRTRNVVVDRPLGFSFASSVTVVLVAKI